MNVEKRINRILTGALAGVMIMTSMPADIYAASVKGVRTEEIIEEVIYEDAGSTSGEGSCDAVTDEMTRIGSVTDETSRTDTVVDELIRTETIVNESSPYRVSYGDAVSAPVNADYGIDNLTSMDSAIQSDYLDNDEKLNMYLGKQIREQQLESGIIDVDEQNSLYDYMSPYDHAISPDPVPADDAAVKRVDYLNLSGNEKVLYDYLAEKIALVASGEITDTDFQIPVSMFNNGKTEYTKEELGVSTLVENNSFTQEAQTALSAIWNIDIYSVMDALLCDHPYELYWYDKNTGVEYQAPGFTSDGTVVSFSGDYVFGMKVAADYSFEAALETYKTDISKINAVNNTITNAMSVVNAAATTTDPSTNQTIATTDYSKLKYYRDWICKNVSYNKAAAASDTIKVNSPWNLIYVFDNDPDTTVVCEGYSKAFKLLCDLTSFQSEYTGAYLVSGGLSDGKKDLGPHMWNIVRMDDGKYYLADITNYDNNPEGRASLFLGKYYGYHTSNKQYDFEVDIQGNYLCFLYDYETRMLYSEEELMLATEAYDPNTTPLPDPITYSVVFINGSKTIKTITVPVDFVIPASEIPQVTKEGYTLSGWYDPDKSGSTPSPFDFSAVITSDLNMYPIWDANEYAIVYDGNGGEGNMSNTAAEYDKDVKLSKCTYTKDDFTFTGWNTVQDGSGTSYADEASVKNLTDENGASVTLYAQWTDSTDPTDPTDPYTETRNLSYDTTATLEYTYTGQAVEIQDLKIVAVIATDNGPDVPAGMERYNYRQIPLTYLTDYTLNYENNVNVSTEENPAKVTVTGVGDYTDFEPLVINFKIKAATDEPGTDPTTPTDPDKPVDPTNPDKPVNPEDPNRKYVAEEGPSVQMKNVEISFPTTSVKYAGEDVTLSDYELKVGDEYLKEDVNYTVKYKNNKKAGKATAVFTGKGRFKGSVNKTFTIEKCDITNVVFAAGVSTFPYGQGGVKPEVIVYSGDIVLPARDYSLKYTGNTQVGGAAKVKVTGKSGAAGEKELPFTIVQAKTEDVVIEADDYAYTGKPKNTTKVVLYDKATGKKLKAGKDYDKNITYTYAQDTVVTDSKTKSEITRHAGDELTKKSTDVIPAGTMINIAVTLKGNYEGTVTGEFRVVQALLSKATIKVPTAYWSDDLADTGFTYDPARIVVVLNGKIVQPSRKVLITGDNGEEATYGYEPNYEIIADSYKNNTKPGKASFKVRGVGNLGGVKTVNFTIIDPNKVTYSYVTFNPNGATSGTMSDKKIAAGKTVNLTKNSYKKTGSTFTGWNTEADGSGDAYADKGAYTAPDKSGTVTLYAQWTAQTYTVTYEGVGEATNENPATYIYDDVEKTELRLNAPVWDEDHVFLGWYSDAACKKRVTGIAQGSTGNLTFYAKWQKNRSAVIRKIAKPEGDYIDATKYADRFYADERTAQYKDAVEERSSWSLSGFTDAVPGDEADDYAAIREAIIVAGRKYQLDNAGITDDSLKKRVTVYLPAGLYNLTINKDRPWGIELEEGVDLVMDNNAIINVDQVKGDYAYYVMSIADEHDGQIANASIRGGQIRGERYIHKGSGDKYDGHGVAIIGATNVSVSDMTISSNWGDGIYIGTKVEDDWERDEKGKIVRSKGKIYYGCSKVTINNCCITDNRRNNISVVDAHDLLIDNCDISDAHGSAPQCGILIEPNFESGRSVKEARCKNVTISNTYISAYQGKDSDKYMCLYTNYDPDDTNYIVVDGLRVENCVFNGYYGIYSGLNYSESGNEYNGTKHIESRVTKGSF